MSEGDMFELGAGLSNEEIWGHGPMGFRTVADRIRNSIQGDERLPKALKLEYRKMLLESGLTAAQIDQDFEKLRL